MSGVFVSYSQADRECALELVARLEASGMKCWIAPRDISPASDWAEEIIDAISAARVMVLVFSSSSNQSPQVRREVERAAHKQVHILPFRIEDVKPSKSLEFFLSSQHWMDAFPPPRDAHYARLCRHLETRLNAPAAEAPVSAPEGASSAGTAGTGGATSGASSVGASTFTAHELAHIEAQLAHYIGPIARHLVRRAALRATGGGNLIARLAAELDREADRSAFAQRCRDLPGVRGRTPSGQR